VTTAALLLLALVQAAASARAPAGQAKPDACALLANDEVKAVLGLDVRERQPGTQNVHGLLLSQCYFGTATPRSVSVAIAGTTKIEGRTVTPRQFWQQQFHPREREKSEEGSAARPIPGVGDEAFWSGTRIAGALYVLKGRTFIRVSVGGIQDEQDRISRSRALALAALKRLPS
jgi:hypothetical protein